MLHPHKCWWHERKKPPKIRLISCFSLQNNKSPGSVRLRRHYVRRDKSAGRDAVFIINITKFQCALWLKHLAAHLWKPMFFNEILVIKWIPWLFCHKTAGEDKTTCNLRSGWSPPLPLPLLSSPFLVSSISYFPSPSAYHSLQSFSSFCFSKWASPLMSD